MKYQRRPEIHNGKRIEIAIQAYIGQGRYGEITRIAQENGISRLFVYQLLWQLLGLFETEAKPRQSQEAKQRQIDQYLLLLRLEGKCSLEAMSQIMKELGCETCSVGYLSQRLKAYGMVAQEEWPTGIEIRFYLSDEIFANGQPILVTVDAKSMAILKIELASARDGETWKAHWEVVQASFGGGEGVEVVSDLGTGLLKGCQMLGMTHHPDLFHVLRGIAWFGGQFEKRAYRLIGEEYERIRLFETAKSDVVCDKRFKACQTALVATSRAIDQYDQFVYLWQEFKACCDLFDQDGRLKDAHRTFEDALAMLDLMAELGSESLTTELKTVRRSLPALWVSVYRAETLHTQLQHICPEPLLALLCAAWQTFKKAKNSKHYHARTSLQHHAQFLLDYACVCFPSGFSDIQACVFETLDSNLRASSLVENINSSLRTLVQTCRGQVTQPLLDLFAYRHNHRPFVRGERKGRSPLEILTGKPLPVSWIDSLLALIHPKPSVDPALAFPGLSGSSPAVQVDQQQDLLAA